jgi:DNA (cytosine-5)-methyltransferase 1
MGKERNLVIDQRRKLPELRKEAAKPVNNRFVRKMTPREWEKLQGFPKDYTGGVADVQRYKQLGNAVTVNVVRHVAKELIQHLFPALGTKVRSRKKRCKVFYAKRQ